jgi:hypothetical protein
MTRTQPSATTFVVSFETQRMPHSTELKRLLRAVDCLYYALLFSGSEEYAGQDEVWRSWVKLGFGTGLQEGPPGAREDDRIRINTFSEGKQLTFTVSAGDPSTLHRWSELLREIDRIRPELAGLETDERVEKLLTQSTIDSELTGPVSGAIKSCSAEEVERIELATRTAMRALSYPIVTACTVLKCV